MAIQDDINELVFVGLVLIKDDIRPEAKLGIELVKKAHINTVMITGDNKDTAVSIANEVGLLDQDSIILTSDELNNMSDDEVKSKLLNLKVVSFLGCDSADFGITSLEFLKDNIELNSLYITNNKIEDIPIIASEYTVKTASSEAFCEGLYRGACCRNSDLHDRDESDSTADGEKIRGEQEHCA